MRAYLVGGAVRDALLGRAVQDRDWVVVGSTPEAMLARGFKTVGKDFPVFLDPASGEEYALARTERKTGRGYGGFSFHASPDVSLEQDLQRRDLTINAIAQDADGTLIDPYGGVRDLNARILRHVGPAFAEDPLRVLRVARFAARFADFSIAPDTLSLMRAMVASGELDALVSERVWQELARGLMEAAPIRLFETLDACGALAAILPELAEAFGDPMRRQTLRVALNHHAHTAQPLPVRWASVLACSLPHHDETPAHTAQRAQALSMRLKTPNDCRDLAVLCVREGIILCDTPTDAAAVLAMLERCDSFRRPERFLALLACFGYDEACARQASTWRTLLHTAAAIDAGRIARETPDKTLIPERIRAARRTAVSACLQGCSDSALHEPAPTDLNHEPLPPRYT